MKHSLALIALSFLAAVNAATVEFRVIAPGATGDVQVSINGQNTKLNAPDADVPYFVGNADLANNAVYKYVVNGKTEEFDRKLEAGRNATRNDFFERPVTYANIPELPWPIKENPQWTRGDGPDVAMWDTNYIPSVFMTGSKEELDAFIANPTKKAPMFPVKFTFIGPDTVDTFESTQFGIHRPGGKKNTAKQSWKWTLPEGKYLGKRNYFKIRHQHMDPTQMREKLYADILRAMGTYANRANMVRLFINGEGYGIFNMLDDTQEYSFIRAMFYDGHPPEKMGPLYDGATGASFKYSEGDEVYWSWKPNPDSPEDWSALRPLTKAWAETDVKDDKQIEAFEKQFDMDQFLRFMVMEYLTADWDGYWMYTSNLGAYRDPTENNKWYYIGQDYDGTFGVNLDVPEGRDFIKIRYEDYPSKYPDAVMINRVLENPKQKEKFEKYLKDTVSVLFNNFTLTNRVLAYHEFILPDLKWDSEIKQRSPGINYGWTFEQTTENLWKAVDAPNQNGGGAGWGLIEYIIAKSQAVAELYNVKITTEPVFPPTQNKTTPTTKPKEPAKPTATASNDKKPEDGKVEAANDKKPENGASSALPQVLTTLGLVGASVYALA
ncbi:hypothetical protein EC973_009657 [Apophysomyces ossiformis]|uniref:Coth protein-domain-containing protein n=1 Tax=Apophysomyces ossiformis TaxID=679940 RepID=A0A8H7EP03_9FUNG|nr:hypothetical protein EC973_009657 [Apophysomyces ossiformis]